jgi:predicted dinucleotide-binding enzyme
MSMLIMAGSLGLWRAGYDPIDAGPLKNARSLESLAFLNIQLSWALGNGPNVGFKFVH